MSEPLRIGFIGAGKQAQAAHLRHFTALEECRVAAIADADPAFAARVAARFGVERSYGSPADLLRQELSLIHI